MRSFNLSSVCALSLLLIGSNASTWPSNDTLGSFYAYGTEISGLPVLYADATAYIGLSGPSTAGPATNITFYANTTTDSPGSELAVTANNTNVSIESFFFINSSANAFQAAGFTSAANRSVTTNQFKVWGTELSWISPSGELQQHWWAVPTGEDSIWSLVWDASNTGSDVGIPIVVKNLAPTPVGSTD